MLSYKQWKNLNESILPSFNLGLGGPSKIGLVLQNGFNTEEDIAEGKKGKKNPKVEVEVKEKEKDSKKEKKHKKCGKMCGKMSKKKMWSDDDDNFEDEEELDDELEDEDDELEDEEEDEEEEDDEEEDDDEEDDDEEEEEDDDEEEEEDDEDDVEMKFSKKSKKKMLKGNQHKLDKNKNGKIDAEDFKMLKKKKMGSDSIQKQIDYHKEVGSDGMPDPKAKRTGTVSVKPTSDFRGGNAYSKNMKKKMKKEDTEWWNSVKNMVSDPNQKFDDGFNGYFQNQNFTPIDLDNLKVAIREPGPGEVGFAPAGKIATAFGMDLTEAAKWTYHGADGLALRGEDGKPRVFDTQSKAHDATEAHGGKAIKTKDGWIVVKFKTIPNQEELKKVGSFRSGEYDMPSRGDSEESKRTLRQDQKSRKFSGRERKKLSN